MPRNFRKILRKMPAQSDHILALDPIFPDWIRIIPEKKSKIDPRNGEAGFLVEAQLSNARIARSNFQS